jgi:hypothetical protein
MVKSKAWPIRDRDLAGRSRASRIQGPSRRHTPVSLVGPCGFRALVHRKPGMACPQPASTGRHASCSADGCFGSHLSAARADPYGIANLVCFGEAFVVAFPNRGVSVPLSKGKEKFEHESSPSTMVATLCSRRPSFRKPARANILSYLTYYALL